MYYVLFNVPDSNFLHMRLHKPTRSLVLDRSIRDGVLALGIRALSCKSKLSHASSKDVLGVKKQ